MRKLKPGWVKTDMPKEIKVKFWKAMKDNPTHSSFLGYLDKHSTEFPDEIAHYFPLSPQTYKKLKDEIMQMPLEEVDTLPIELQTWILALRLDLKKEQAEKEAGKATATTSGEPYEETTHKLKIRETAKAMAERINLPSIWDTDLWRDLPVDFQPGKYSIPIGAVEIGRDKQIKVNCYDIGAGVAAPHLVKGLYTHLRTSGLSKFVELVARKGKLDSWAVEVAQYSKALLKFLTLIADEVKGYRATVRFYGEAKPGLTKWFIVTAWNDALQKAGGYSWINNSWYKPPEIIPGTNLWKLNCGAYVIGIAKSEKRLKTYENWHKKLRLKYAEDTLAKDIAVKDDELSNIAQDIRQRLQEFSDMQRLPGHCELC